MYEERSDELSDELSRIIHVQSIPPYVTSLLLQPLRRF